MHGRDARRFDPARFEPGTLATRSGTAQDGRTVTLRPVDRVADFALLHRWMNDPEVAEWWELSGKASILREYMEIDHALAHTMAWLALVEGHPFGYVETYLPAFDAFAKSYPARQTDRGFHILVGEETERGSGAARALVRVTVNGLFDDPAAQRVLCEPNVKNARMLAFCAALGGSIEREVDLPSKRAAVVVWDQPIA